MPRNVRNFAKHFLRQLQNFIMLAYFLQAIKGQAVFFPVLDVEHKDLSKLANFCGLFDKISKEN